MAPKIKSFLKITPYFVEWRLNISVGSHWVTGALFLIPVVGGFTALILPKFTEYIFMIN